MSRKIYIVADPSAGPGKLLEKLKGINSEQVFAVQIWNNFPEKAGRLSLIKAVFELCNSKGIPLFINENLDLIGETCFDGFHLDEPVEDFQNLKESRPDLQWGLTCNNEPKYLQWAQKESFDYISFCSVFPSKTSNSCDLVTPESIRNAITYFQGDVFLAGGINKQSIEKLEGLPFDGIALVSAVMDAPEPAEALSNFYQLLNR